VDPGIGEHITFVNCVRLPGQRLRRFDEVVHAALALGQVRAVDLVNAVRNPVHNQRLHPGVPQRAVDLEILRIDRVELGGGRR
jgi:hypothetical protein